MSVNGDWNWSRVMTTTTSRPVSMTHPDFNLNPVIDVLPRLWGHALIVRLKIVSKNSNGSLR